MDELTARPMGSLLDVATADWTFVNGALAKLYGLPAPAAGAWARATFPSGQRGAGFVTQGLFLTMTAPHPGVEPIKRGQIVRQTLLCQRLPAPPPGVPALDQAKVPATASDRDRLAAHRSNPTCAPCHQMLDPVGFGLSGFDGIGAARATEASGAPVDTHGTIVGFDTPDFDGPRELGQRLRASPDLPGCIVTELFRFAQGRSDAADDACVIGQIREGFRAGGETYPALVDALVRSDAFRSRRLPTGGTP
jgi:hypothetical protein